MRGQAIGRVGVKRWCLAAAAGALCVTTACLPRPAPGQRFHVPKDFAESLPIAASNLRGAPAGANIDCAPTSERPRPVILLHGILGNMADNMNGLSPQLANSGYCVFALNYGEPPGSIFGGLRDMRRAALDEFGPFVDAVLARTGARQVDVIGHSEGSVMPRWWMRYGDSEHDDGTPKVANVVGIAPASEGEKLDDYADEVRSIPLFSSVLAALAANGCAACEQLVAGSQFLDDLNTSEPRPGERFSGPVQPGVDYLMLATEWDNLVVPFESGFIDRPSVTNMTVQDACAIDRADHLSIVFDPVVYDLVETFLTPEQPVDQRCVATRSVFPPRHQKRPA